MEKKESGVYLIRAGNSSYYKIGFGYFKDRLTALQTGNHERLRIIKTCPGDKKLESYLHNKYKKYRGVGEWFMFDAGTIEKVLLDYNKVKVYSLQESKKEIKSGSMKTSFINVYNVIVHILLSLAIVSIIMPYTDKIMPKAIYPIMLIFFYIEQKWLLI